MSDFSRHILYVAHGADCFIYETAYSILSLWQQNDGLDYSISVVTDRADLLFNLLNINENQHHKINILNLDSKQRDIWKGKHGYIHRIKPLAIQWAAQQIIHDIHCADHENNRLKKPLFLFVDSDTTFKKSPADLFKIIETETIILNESEGTIAERRHLMSAYNKLYKVCKKNKFDYYSSIFNEKTNRNRLIDIQTVLWNSGVIGFTDQLLPLLDESVDLIDQMYDVLQIHTIEQIALSVILSAHHLSMTDSGDVVFHYHAFKEFRQDLILFFDYCHRQNLNTNERIIQMIKIDPFIRIQPKLDFFKNPKWKRQIKKRIGQNWKALPFPF